MNNTVKKAVLGAFISAAVFAAANASADTYTYAGSTAEIASPGSITWNFNAAGGAAALNFELAGYKSLDGNNGYYTDIFSLTVNGNNIYNATFNLGGGGYYQVVNNPNELTATINATNNPSNNPTLITWAGGTVDIAGAISLNAGANSVVFSYDSPSNGYLGGYAGPQGTGDEGWGINNAAITQNVAAVPEPETYAMLLAGLGLMGFMVSRRKA